MGGTAANSEALPRSSSSVLAEDNREMGLCQRIACKFKKLRNSGLNFFRNERHRQGVVGPSRSR